MYFLLTGFPQFNLPGLKYACSDVSKCKTSITTLMTLEFLNAPNKCVPSVQFSTGFTSIVLNAPIEYETVTLANGKTSITTLMMLEF